MIVEEGLLSPRPPNTMKDVAEESGLAKDTLCGKVVVGRKRPRKKRFPMKRLLDNSTEIVEVGAMVGLRLGRRVGRKVGDVIPIVNTLVGSLLGWKEGEGVGRELVGMLVGMAVGRTDGLADGGVVRIIVG